MVTPQHFLDRAGAILGGDFSTGTVNLKFSWKSRQEGKALLDRFRAQQRELRLLKRDLSALISSIKSEFTAQRTRVGKTVGAGIAGAVFGRRNVGRMNSMRRDELRREQFNVVEPYERVKRVVNQILHQIDCCKTQIQPSPTYQSNQHAIVAAVPPALPAPPLRRFFVFTGGQVKGPYTSEQLCALSDAGAVTGSTPCCAEGMQQWVNYSEVVI